jgi:hypothetical protein
MPQSENKNDIVRLDVLIERHVSRLAAGYHKFPEIMIRRTTDKRMTGENLEPVENHIMGRQRGYRIFIGQELEKSVEVVECGRGEF